MRLLIEVSESVDKRTFKNAMTWVAMMACIALGYILLRVAIPQDPQIKLTLGMHGVVIVASLLIMCGVVGSYVLLLAWGDVEFSNAPRTRKDKRLRIGVSMIFVLSYFNLLLSLGAYIRQISQEFHSTETGIVRVVEFLGGLIAQMSLLFALFAAGIAAIGCLLMSVNLAFVEVEYKNKSSRNYIRNYIKKIFQSGMSYLRERASRVSSRDMLFVGALISFAAILWPLQWAISTLRHDRSEVTLIDREELSEFEYRLSTHSWFSRALEIKIPSGRTWQRFSFALGDTLDVWAKNDLNVVIVIPPKQAYLDSLFDKNNFDSYAWIDWDRTTDRKYRWTRNYRERSVKMKGVDYDAYPFKRSEAFTLIFKHPIDSVIVEWSKHDLLAYRVGRNVSYFAFIKNLTLRRFLPPADIVLGWFSVLAVVGMCLFVGRMLLRKRTALKADTVFAEIAGVPQSAAQNKSKGMAAMKASSESYSLEYIVGNLQRFRNEGDIGRIHYALKASKERFREVQRTRNLEVMTLFMRQLGELLDAAHEVEKKRVDIEKTVEFRDDVLAVERLKLELEQEKNRVELEKTRLGLERERLDLQRQRQQLLHELKTQDEQREETPGDKIKADGKLVISEAEAALDVDLAARNSLRKWGKDRTDEVNALVSAGKLDRAKADEQIKEIENLVQIRLHALDRA